MFDVDGTLLLSDRSLGGYEVLPGAIEALSSTLKERAVPFVLFDQRERLPAGRAGRRWRVGLPVATSGCSRHRALRRISCPETSRAGTRAWRRGVGQALAKRGSKLRTPRTRRASSGCRFCRVASGMHHEGHRGRLRRDLGRREIVRGLGCAFFRDQARTNDGLLVRDCRSDPANDSGSRILTGKPSVHALRFVARKLGIPPRTVGSRRRSGR